MEQRNGMRYTRNFSSDIPEIKEKIFDFLNGRNARWRIESQTGPLRDSEKAGAPGGRASLTLQTSDLNLREELNDLFRKLEEEHESQPA
jgi:hypothetical protein